MAYDWEAELTAGTRSRVVWIGRQIPDNLLNVGRLLNINLEEIRNVDRISPHAADLLAVLVSAVGNQDIQKADGRLLKLLTLHLQDYGVLVGAISSNPSDAYRIQNTLFQKRGVNILAFDLSNIDDLASKLWLHQATHPAVLKYNFPLPGHKQEDYSQSRRAEFETDGILLRRAFSEFNKVTLIKLDGGRSKDCNVWTVQTYRDSNPCEPFVAKAGRLQDLQDEFNTYRDFVRDYIPFPFRAPLLETYFVKGATRAVLVSALVGRSLRLDDYLIAASNPELVMVSLFEGALRKWRRTMIAEHASLGHFYVEQQKEAAKLFGGDANSNSLLPSPNGLKTAYEVAKVHDNALPNPAEFWEKFAAEPQINYYICRAHGDLNVRNVFVRWNSIDTILIDFSHSGIRESLARDPAKLETSIALTVTNEKKEKVSESTLRQIYKGPLLPPRTFPVIDARTDAIYQIRRLAAGEGVSSYEYEVLVLCHLLRFAYTPDNVTSADLEIQNQRALCYSLACGLLRNLKSQV
jgi:hypothetical protein